MGRGKCRSRIGLRPGARKTSRQGVVQKRNRDHELGGQDGVSRGATIKGKCKKKRETQSAGRPRLGGLRPRPEAKGGENKWARKRAKVGRTQGEKLNRLAGGSRSRRSRLGGHSRKNKRGKMVGNFPWPQPRECYFHATQTSREDRRGRTPMADERSRGLHRSVHDLGRLGK